MKDVEKVVGNKKKYWPTIQ